MLVDLQPEPDFLQNSVGLVLAGFTGLDCCFVLVLAKIHEFAHRRLGLRCYLNKIQVRFGGQTQGVLDTDDPHLFAGRTYQPHLGDADPIIDSWLANVWLLIVVVTVTAPQQEKAPYCVRNRRPRMPAFGAAPKGLRASIPNGD
ncbi:hypothetical protein AHIS1636_07910 [Arthrobacter mangrovi]|uniref:Uncharacterized protein n=1 Tax=Arthrobacter mangrovi TaxID=2966350 RepID=A0ABQ5MQU7_9MICC|nr:hypothetical protein AHIS1636_07910 [Arthrobacter mangrovi]